MTTSFSADEIYLILMRYHNRLDTEDVWDKYLRSRKKQVFPYSNEIKEVLNEDWNTIKKRVFELLNTDPSLAKFINDEEKFALLDIKLHKMLMLNQLKPYHDYLNSVRMYNEFRKENPQNCLPHSQSIIKAFGTWNAFKEEAGLEVLSVGNPPYLYTDEQLIEMLEKYGRYFSSEAEWSHFIKHDAPVPLPSFRWIVERLPHYVINQYRKRFDYSEEDIMKTIAEHRHMFPQGILKWNQYAQEHRLPSYQTLKRKLSDEELERLMQKSGKT